MVDKTVDKVADKQPIKVADKQDRERIILDYSQKHEFITTANIIELLGVSATTAKRILHGLVDSGLLAKSGNNKTRKYFAK
jgi:DeoR/GlpR family transcriptional regulator of sugar metabolism